MGPRDRRFAWFFAVSQLRLRYRYTSLGFLWNFLEPALFLGVLSVIFSVVNRMDVRDYAVFLFSALVPWRYVEKAVNTGMDSIVGGDWLLKKLPVSPFTFPLTRWITASVEFLFSLVVLFAVFGLLRGTFTVHVLLLPLSIVPWALLALGGALVTAVLFTFFRDVRPIVQMLLLLAFFSAPILFRPDLFPAGSPQALIVTWHPLTYFAALFQKPLYEAAWPSATDWAVSSVLGVLAVLAGSGLVSRYRRDFYFYL